MSPNMSLIPALVQELLKIFVWGGLRGPPSGGIGLNEVEVLKRKKYISGMSERLGI